MWKVDVSLPDQRNARAAASCCESSIIQHEKGSSQKPKDHGFMQGASSCVVRQSEDRPTPGRPLPQRANAIALARLRSKRLTRAYALVDVHMQVFCRALQLHTLFQPCREPALDMTCSMAAESNAESAFRSFLFMPPSINHPSASKRACVLVELAGMYHDANRQLRCDGNVSV
ncbi:hypothetical protein CSOJ01_00481 [Colletotrichum sojae]|uniref:Uncharacterized protein n=1 Tax=Colletotrichum sojae TaxID=2175907 RepID=A0A8H6JYA1_9PEZI|nr:hypothetical protein CSOJ01_00481 [Colletotrichum sojae]